MPEVTSLSPGDPRRVGRYPLAGRVRGGFLARKPDGGALMVRLLSEDRAADPAARDRFAAEARAARRVPPFCVARILDAGFESGRPFLVSEFTPGPTLAQVVLREGPLPPGIVQAVALGAATGLAAIHQAGLVHGSFGPDRLVLSPDGPLVIDFSITPPYGPATPAADMLAWADTVTFAAAGGPPTWLAAPLTAGPAAAPAGTAADRAGSGPGAARGAALPDPLASLVLACQARDPAARPTARAVLTQLLGEDGIRAGLLAEGKSHAAAAARPEAAASPRPGAVRASRVPAGHAGARRAGAARGRSRPARRGIWAGIGVICLVGATGAAYSLLSRPARPGAAARGQGPDPGPARLVVPAAFAGHWHGPVHQRNPVLTVTVQVDLAAGARGGTISYPGLGCSGRLSVTGLRPGKLTARQTIVTGQQSCVNGVITLARASQGRLTFTFLRADGATPTGTLSRTGP